MCIAVAFNRWMRKTARPVVWEGAGAKSPAPDPIQKGRAVLVKRQAKLLELIDQLARGRLIDWPNQLLVPYHGSGHH